jgi:hypothetical protein
MTSNQITRVSRLPEAEESLREAVYTAIGHGSMCWDPRPEGVFDDVEARKAAEDLLMRIKVILGVGDPHLGLASNAEIHAEIQARQRIGHTDDGYRTVEPGEPLWHIVQEEWVGKEVLWQHRDFPQIYSTDRGRTWYNIDDGVDPDGNPRTHRSLS